MSVRLVSIALLVCLSGCFARVTFPPLPGPDASADARAKVYAELSPVPPTTDLYGVSNVGLGIIKLNNGTTVGHPGDLVPLVQPSSMTAWLAAEYEKSQTWLGVSLAVAISFMAAGIVLQATSLPPGSFDGTSAVVPPGSGRQWTVGTSLLLTSLVPLGLVTVFGFSAARERAAAYASYPADLRRALQLDEARPAPPPSAHLLPSVVPAR